MKSVIRVSSLLVSRIYDFTWRVNNSPTTQPQTEKLRSSDRYAGVAGLWLVCVVAVNNSGETIRKNKKVKTLSKDLRNIYLSECEIFAKI